LRPVDRGAWPQSGGANIVFADYADARRFLYDRLGHACSYCNRRLESAAVEHIQPKKPAGVYNAARALDWENLLLACTNCNSRKGDNDVVLDDHLWPDRDNTMRAVDYHDSGSVGVPSALVGTSDEPIAWNTIRLTGIDHVPKLDPAGNVPTTATDPQARDTRWEHRRKAWAQAVDARQDLLDAPSDALRRHVLREAEAIGYWPIWYRHLADLPGMRDELVKLLPGTAHDCFAPDGQLLPRGGGRL